jgi:hypothetical protein
MMLYLISYPDQVINKILCVLRAFVVQSFFFYRPLRSRCKECQERPFTESEHLNR